MCPDQKIPSDRDAVIAEALTWMGTPFHFGARVKGAGVDCAQFIAAVYEACGIFTAEDYGFFGADWQHHTNEDHYRYRLVRHATELPHDEEKPAEPEPGLIALSRVGRVFSHAGIVIAWPEIIHAHPQRGVVRAHADRCAMWIGWEHAFFNPFHR